MRQNPLDLPDELLWSPWKRLGFFVGAWFLLFLPGIAVALRIALILSFVKATGLHL